MTVPATEAFLIYRDYYYNGNSLGTSPKEMAEVVKEYEDLIPRWQKCIQAIADDENKYIDFDDSEYAQCLENGRKEGENATDGYEGKTGGQIADSTSSAVGAVGGLTLSFCGQGAVSAMGNGVTKIKDFFANIGSKTAGQAAGQTGSKASGEWCAWLAAALAIATAVKYWITRPNKKAVDALNSLQSTMAEKQGELSQAQGNMTNAGEKLAEKADEASTANEEANYNIEAQKTNQDFYLVTYNKLKAKSDSGKALTKEERELFRSVSKYINDAGTNIKSISKENSEHLEDLYSDMEDFEFDYVSASETMATAEGLTEYSAGFDKTTKTMCYVEAVSQGLNVLSGLTSGLRLIGQFLNPWAIATGIAAMGASVSSWFAADEQVDFAGKASEAVDNRLATEDANLATQEVYDIEADNFEAYMVGIESLEMEIPKDIATVDPSVPTNKTNPDDGTNTALLKKDTDK